MFAPALCTVRNNLSQPCNPVSVAPLLIQPILYQICCEFAVSTSGNENRQFRCSWDEQWFSYKVAAVNPVDWNSLWAGCGCSMGNGFATCSYFDLQLGLLKLILKFMLLPGQGKVGSEKIAWTWTEFTFSLQQRHLELGLFICLGWIQGNEWIPIREIFLGTLLLLNFLSGVKCTGWASLSELAAKWLPRNAQASECHLEMEMCEWIHCTPWFAVVG